MNGLDSVNKTQTQLIPLVFKEFLPEKDIFNGEVLREDYEKLRIVYELQRDIAPEIKINAVLNRILDRTSEILNYEHAVVLLVNKRRKLEPRAYRNVEGNKTRLLSKTLIRHVAKKRKGLIASDILKDGRFNKAESVMLSGMRSTIAVPILHRKEVLGVIVIQSRAHVGAYKEKDLHLMMNIANHTAQFIKNSLLHEELRNSFTSAIRTLSAVVDARHPLTAGHSERVAQLSLAIGEALGLTGNQLETLNYAALLHDIGKIGIPDRILLKDGPFNDVEREEMNNHPRKTKDILEKFHFPRALKQVPSIAALHHERIDGGGYPEGLCGDKLPFEAKIMAVADVFDALTSLRDYPKYDEKGEPIYTERMPISEAVAIIEKEAGTHFEPKIVRAFKRCLPPVLLHFRGKHFDKDYVDEYTKTSPINAPIRPISASHGNLKANAAPPGHSAL
jgi:HD-GYP domain-containing protein (c-di-GMP phosphodiesterase class II)